MRQWRNWHTRMIQVHMRNRAGSSPVWRTKGEFMKKLLLTLLVLCLTACGGSKKITWEDVKATYEEVESSATSKIESLDEILKEDYLELTDYIRDNYGNVIYDSKASGKDYVELYKKALELRLLSSMNNSINANELGKLADNVIELIKASLESEDAVNTIKAQILDKVADVYTWEDKIWLTLEKRNKIEWSKVEKQYEFIDENFRTNMTPNTEVSEPELEELKKDIVNNYQEISNGINADNHEIAKKMYESAKKLWWYTKFIYSDNADKVFYFAEKTMDYIKSQYQGYVSEHEPYDYEEEITQAKKYTQSVFNEIAILLRQVQ